MKPSPFLTSASRPRSKRALLCGAVALLVLACVFASHHTTTTTSAQQKTKGDAAPAATGSMSPASASRPLLTRTTTRHELRRFNYGSTLTVYGAPQGSITIEAWPQSNIDITADIELRADTEEELTQLAAVNGFLIDDDSNHLTIVTTGTHDRKFMKRAARNFPKKLFAMPWKIDYRIRVPASTDLEIYAGRGSFSLSGVEGAMRLNGGASDAALTLTGGSVEATFERGTIMLRLAGRSWRGRGANIRLATGDLNVELPANFNADIDASVLRTGRIDNTSPGLAPRERTTQTERSQYLRAGAGGPVLSFVVGDGTIRLKPEHAKP